MKKKVIIFGGIIFLVLVVVGLVVFRQMSAGFNWYDDAVKNEYNKMTWQEGELSSLVGLDAKYEAKEMRAEKCATLDELEKNDYLRVEGGLCPLPVKVYIKDENGQEKNVGGVSQLLEILGKIDSPEKALSLVLLTTSDMQRTADSLVATRNTKVEGGYLVEYVADNSFGCGTHQPLKKIVLVSESGMIKTVASEQEKPSLEPEVCVD